jgi:putative DNA primase/helicase
MNESLDRAKVSDALRHIAADCPFDSWLAIGMALHAWNSVEGRGLWDMWSRTAPARYDEKAIGQHWQTFTAKPGGVTIATLFKLATDAGWRPAAPRAARPTGDGRSLGHGVTRDMVKAKPATPRNSLPTWGTIEAAAAAFPRFSKRLEGATVGKIFTCYESDGMAPRGAEVRYRMPDGTKECRPFRFESGQWHSGAPKKWTIHGLPDLPADGPVFIPEGPKCGDAMRKAGLPAVASFGGASGARKTNWRPLAGRDCVLLPDADEAGESYAATVAAILHKQGCSVRVLRLPGLTGGQDVVDFLEAGNDGASVARLAADAPAWTPPAEKEAPHPAATDAMTGDVKALRAKLWETATAEKIGTTEKQRLSAAFVIEWLHARGRLYHHSDRRDFAGVMYFDATRKLLLPVQSDAFLAWLADCMSVNRAERLFQFAASAVETEGLSDRSRGIEPATYWASRPGAIYLSNGPGRMARLTAGRVELVDNGTDNILFPVGACLEPWTLTAPVDPFTTCALFADMAATAAHGPMLFILWATALPADGKTKPPACFTAPVGGGKTAIVRGLFALLGMPETVNAVSKNGEGDFWAAVDAGGMVCFDNVDTRVEWLPDALAAAATAGTFTKRRLYTDADRVTLRARASIAVTSASPNFASDAGLADRLLVIRMKRRTGETAESALFAEVRRNRDAGLSWICATLAKALADAAPVPTGLNARHPDFAALAVRIGRACGREAEAVAALRAAEADKGLFNIENDSIGAALLELLAAGPFIGTAGELLEKLKEVDSAFDGRLSDKRLGKRLSKLWPHLESTLRAIKERDGHTRTWIYTFRPPSVAGFAGFGEPFSEKSHARENIGTFTESPLETPQTPQADFDFTEETDPEPEIEEGVI